MSRIDDHFLPGVSFTFDGESVPSRELSWVMYSSCGCVAGMHMMTEDTINLDAAWKMMSGNAAMIKQDRARGFTIKMAKHRDVSVDDCTHSPKWGYVPTPIPAGHSWATTERGKTRHLVPLVALDKEAAKEAEHEWVEGEEKWWLQKFTSLCGAATETTRSWTKKWYSMDNKTECTRCVKTVHAMVLPLEIEGEKEQVATS